MKYFATLSMLLLLVCGADAQKKNQNKFKFGDIKPEDFAPTVYEVDSSADAVVLADIGTSDFIGNPKGDGLALEFVRQRRIRLLDKNSFDKVAVLEIPLYKNTSDIEVIEKLEAYTYNLENGKVVQTKVDKNSVFTEKLSDNWVLKKFTFPNLKEGCIIEYRYSVSSPFYFNLHDWEFQEHDIPTLWSEYSVTIPTEIYDFALIKQHYVPFVIDTTTEGKQVYNITFHGNTANSSTQTVQITSNTATGHWAMQNVPALKKEPFITSMENYIAKIEFQLRHYYDQYHIATDVLGDWNQLVQRLMERDDFGVPINKNNGWLDDDVKAITAGAKTNAEKAKKVFEYIRDNFTNIDKRARYMSKSMKKVWDDKSGNVADINLTMIAALNSLGFTSQPVLLSTRANGKANEIYPLIDKFNYVICITNVDDVYYLLDASDPYNAFNHLPEYCYNGSGRIIGKDPFLVDLSSDSLHESKVTTVFMMGDDKGMSASFSTQYGYFASQDVREKMKAMKQEDYFGEIKKSFVMETELTNMEIDSLKKYEEPVTVKFDATFATGGEDIIYFDPMMSNGVKENPFKSADRFFPVEMPYCTDETYILNMEIPAGYKIDEMPKSARVNLNEDEGMFEYIIAQGGGRIQLRCRLLLKKATFHPEDYQTLRDFYAFVVAKESEQIVFKKQ